MGTAGSMCQGIGSLVENSIGLLQMTEPTGYITSEPTPLRGGFSVVET